MNKPNSPALLFIFLISAMLCTHQGWTLPDRDSFIAKLNEEAPLWMDEQIQSDFAPFKDGISTKKIDTLYHQMYGNLLTSFKVNNNRLYSDISQDWTGRSRIIQAALLFLIDAVGLPDLDLLITMHDGYDYPVSKMEVPFLSFAKKKTAAGVVLIPDVEALGDYRARFSPEALSIRPWDEKEKKVFWRGTTTGIFYTVNNWATAPRSQLVLKSKEYPHLIDALFTSVVQCDSAVPGILMASGLVGPWRDVGDHLNYLYLVDIDGNSCTYSRCYWILLSNSLMFKQVSNNIQWYYKGIAPYQHYVPLKENVEDIIEQIQWAALNDDKARQIADQATEFAKESLSIENIYIYFYKVLLEHARLQELAVTSASTL